MHVEPFVEGSNPPKWPKKAQFCMYVHVNKKCKIITCLILKSI